MRAGWHRTAVRVERLTEAIRIFENVHDREFMQVKEQRARAMHASLADDPS